MAAVAEEHLGVPVDHRPAGAPQAVPDEQVPIGRWIRAPRGVGPAASEGEQLGDICGVEGERIVGVEDEHAVVDVVGGDVRAARGLPAPHPTPARRRRAVLNRAERVVERGGHLRRQPLVIRLATAAVDRPPGAERGEDRAIERDAVQDAHDALLAHRIERAEMLANPGRHRGRRIGAGDVDPNLEQSLGAGAGSGRERGHELGEASDRRRRRRIGQVRVACDGSPSQLFGRASASHSSRSMAMTWMSQNSPSANIARRSVPSCRKPAFR